MMNDQVSKYGIFLLVDCPM